jgi:hypothetical protein
MEWQHVNDLLSVQLFQGTHFLLFSCALNITFPLSNFIPPLKIWTQKAAGHEPAAKKA